MARYPLPFSVGPPVAAIGVLDSLPLGIALLDRRGVCVRTNDVFDQTVGISCQRAEGGVLAIAFADDRPQLAAVIETMLGGRNIGQECRVRLAARPHETVLLTIVRTPAGWGFALMLTVRDIREQMRLERQVAQVTKMQAVGQLAGGIAHDFNNILTAVLGLCDQLLERNPVGTADHEDIEQIRQNGNRAANLVRQLLAFARQQTLRPKVLEIEAIIDGLVPLLHRLLGSGVTLTILHGVDLGAVRVDPGQLEQVIVNLAVNAGDAMSGSGTLTIETRVVEAAQVASLGHDIMPTVDHVAVVVSDTGTGIPPEIAAKIFEPFFTTKPTGQGTGLGLSTVYGIVKQTGGFVFASARPGGGTSFALYFPAAPREAGIVTPVPVASTIKPIAGTVLLVEDDRAVRLVVQRALMRHGLTVVTAADAFIALDILDAAHHAIDVLVSDVVMPGMDGVTLLKQARERLPGLHVVLMSGYAEPPQRRALGHTGVVFLAKPFAVNDLIEAVHGAIAA